MSEESAESPASQRSWPPLPWGICAAYLLFLIALALPVMNVMFDGTWNGFRCARYCAEEFLKLLRDPSRGRDSISLREASLTLPNLAMLFAPGLFLVPGPRRRLWPAIAATLAAVHALYFPFSFGLEELPYFRIGYWVWVASFVTLAASLWLWEARVRRADQSAPPAG